MLAMTTSWCMLLLFSPFPFMQQCFFVGLYLCTYVKSAFTLVPSDLLVVEVLHQLRQ